MSEIVTMLRNQAERLWHDHQCNESCDACGEDNATSVAFRELADAIEKVHPESAKIIAGLPGFFVSRGWNDHAVACAQAGDLLTHLVTNA